MKIKLGALTGAHLDHRIDFPPKLNLAPGIIRSISHGTGARGTSAADHATVRMYLGQPVDEYPGADSGIYWRGPFDPDLKVTVTAPAVEGEDAA